MKNYIPKVHDYVEDEAFWPVSKIWYKDSLAIQEIKKMSINIDSSGKETRTVTVNHFTFVDIRTRSLYEYSSFSDTAKLIRKYNKPDSVNQTGFWTFYGPALKDIQGYQPPLNIGDTIIDKILYKRMKLAYIAPDSLSQFKEKIEYVTYFRCDLKNFMFDFAKRIPNTINCPCVRKDQLPTSENAACVSQFIELINNQLTTEELKVFDAWERYANKNPIK